MSNKLGDKLDDQKTDRTHFCSNCFHFKKSQCDNPCITCFGVNPNGTLYCYRNWEEEIDYV